jgi:purine-cytosine permease-like protein
MTDAPSGNGSPADDSDQPYEPSGLRRSSFTPPPADAPLPSFADDTDVTPPSFRFTGSMPVVPDAVAEETVQRVVPPTAASGESGSAEPVAAPPALTFPPPVAVEPSTSLPAPIFPPPVVAEATPEPAVPAAESAVPAPGSAAPEPEIADLPPAALGDDLRRDLTESLGEDLGEVSTLDAIARLELELERRGVASGPISIIAPTPVPPVEDVLSALPPVALPPVDPPRVDPVAEPGLAPGAIPAWEPPPADAGAGVASFVDAPPPVAGSEAVGIPAPIDDAAGYEFPGPTPDAGEHGAGETGAGEPDAGEPHAGGDAAFEDAAPEGAAPPVTGFETSIPTWSPPGDAAPDAGPVAAPAAAPEPVPAAPEPAPVPAAEPAPGPESPITRRNLPDPFAVAQAPAPTPPALVEPPPFPAALSDEEPVPAAGDVPADRADDIPPPTDETSPASAPLVADPAAPASLASFPPPLGIVAADLPPVDPATGQFLLPTPAVDGLAAPSAEPGLLLPPLAVDPEAPAPAPGPLSFEQLLRDPTAALDREFGDDDVVDDVDSVFGTGAIPIAADGVVAPLAPPSQPIPIQRLDDDELALGLERRTPPVLEVETTGPEPTPLDQRAGRSARLFWLWFAPNSSILSLALGAVLFTQGMSLRQSIIAALAGVAVSFLPLGLGTLAGKWSGQPTMIVSRASFGTGGNVVPAVLSLVSRVFWGATLLWLFAAGTGHVLVFAGLDADLGALPWSLIALVVGLGVTVLVGVFGYSFVARVQLVLSIVSAIVIVGAAVLTYGHLDVARALETRDGSWLLVLGGAVTVFSLVGLAWVHSAGDLARYQRPESYGGAPMLWATFGATLPPFLLIAWGAMLAASDPTLAAALASDPLAAVASLLPGWYPLPLILAAGLGLLSGAIITVYSGGFALQAIGVRARRGVATLIAALLVAIAAVVLLLVVDDATALLTDLTTTIAVPVAAWAGIFAAETMIRTRTFDTRSLLAPGGVYPAVRWVNLVALVLVTVIGFGLSSGTLPWLSWQGFLFPLLGVPAADPIATTDIGVFVALLLGLLVPLVAGVPAIRRQERAMDGADDELAGADDAAEPQPGS